MASDQILIIELAISKPKHTFDHYFARVTTPVEKTLSNLDASHVAAVCKIKNAQPLEVRKKNLHYGYTKAKDIVSI